MYTSRINLLNLVPYFSLFKNTIIPTNDESSHRYYSKMESIVRPLLFIYSKTCSTRSKFNYHSNYSPSSTIIYVTRTLILKRRSAHRCVLSRFDFKGVVPQSIPYLLVAIQNHGRSKISPRSLEGKRGTGRKRRRFLFHGSRGCTPGSIFILVVENFQGKRGWSREI